MSDETASVDSESEPRPIFWYRYDGTTDVDTWIPPAHWTPGLVQSVGRPIDNPHFIAVDQTGAELMPAPPAELSIPDFPEPAPLDAAAVPEELPVSGDHDAPSEPPDPYVAAVTPDPDGA